MYLEHFELSDFPFIQSAKDELYCLTEDTEKQIRLVQHWIAAGHDMLLITGAAGVGRSAMVHHAIDDSELEVQQVNLSGLPLDSEEFLQHIVLELGIETIVSGRLPLQHAIRQHLKKSVSTTARFCLVIDHAESLDQEKLEFLQSLSTAHDLYLPLSLVVLIGDEAMGRRIQKHRKDGSVGMISRVIPVKPMKETQTAEFIAHRLALVGDEEQTVFSGNCIKLIQQQTKGNPAQVNALCDEAMLIAAAGEEYQVSPRHLHDATRQLGWAVKFTASRDAGKTTKRKSTTKRRAVNTNSLLSGAALIEKTRRGSEGRRQQQLENSVHRLIQNVTTIGRAPDCGIRINEEDISPYQALIVKTAGGMMIRNEGGEVPIYVNGTRVENANLKKGDKVRIGTYELEVQADHAGGVSLVSTPALA